MKRMDKESTRRVQLPPSWCFGLVVWWFRGGFPFALHIRARGSTKPPIQNTNFGLPDSCRRALTDSSRMMKPSLPKGPMRSVLGNRSTAHASPNPRSGATLEAAQRNSSGDGQNSGWLLHDKIGGCPKRLVSFSVLSSNPSRTAELLVAQMEIQPLNTKRI